MTNTLRHASGLRRAQGGAILITAVIFLMILSMFVLSMVRSGTFEERIARNNRDRQVALEAAEAMLRHAEESQFASAPFDPYNAAAFTSACDAGLCFRPDAAHLWSSINWSATTQTRTFSAAAQVAGLTAQPRYIVEIVTPPIKNSSSGACEPGLAKVTARGVGNDGATAFVQSTVRFEIKSTCN